MDDENTPNELVAETSTPPIQVSELVASSVDGVESTSEPVEPIPDTLQEVVQKPSVHTVDLSTTEPVTTLASEPTQLNTVEPAPAPLTSDTLQTQSLAQQDQVGFIHSLLIKAQAKIQFNKQKKLDKIVQFAQKKKTITNNDIQKLLRVSDATATRYLVKLVQQGHLARAGNPRDAKYQFLQ